MCFGDVFGLLAVAFAGEILTFEALPFPNAVTVCATVAVQQCPFPLLYYHLGQFFLFELFCFSTIFSWTG